MFKKTKNVHLTDEEIKKLEASMSKKELKEFKKRQKELADKEWEDGLLMGMIFFGD